MTHEQITALTATGESETLEFKHTTGTRREAVSMAKHNVSDFWKTKISKNRERDANDYCQLCEMGWTVIRLWQHDLERDFEKSIERVVSALRTKTAE